MKEHEGDEDFMREEINGEDAISDEFNKFLEKRVEAVEKEWIWKFIKNIPSVLNNILMCHNQIFTRAQFSMKKEKHSLLIEYQN